MKYELTEQQLSNLILFLDRLQFTGLKEYEALREILTVLGNPIKEEVK